MFLDQFRQLTISERNFNAIFMLSTSSVQVVLNDESERLIFRSESEMYLYSHSVPSVQTNLMCPIAIGAKRKTMTIEKI